MNKIGKRLFDKKFWATAFTLTGAIIGAGILGLPYVFAQSGVLIGLMWLIILGTIVMYVCLCLGEVCLRTKGKHHLVGYAGMYLGSKGKKAMFLALVFGIYSALLAYLIGEGQSLSQLFTGSLDSAIYFALGFWLIMAFMLKEGLRALKKVETWGVLVIIIIIFGIFLFYFGDVNVDNYSYNNFNNFFLPFGVVLFALMGFSSIPELRMEIKGCERDLKRAIIFGVSVPIVLYALFSLIFVGVLGREVSQVATLEFGKLVTILGVFTMLTSYFVLSFSLKDILKFDLKQSRERVVYFVSIAPLFIYFLLYYFNWLNFIVILGIGGVISGGLTGILILFMNKKAKEKGNRKPEFSVPINWFVISLLSLIFVMGIVVEVLL